MIKKISFSFVLNISFLMFVFSSCSNADSKDSDGKIVNSKLNIQSGFPQIKEVTTKDELPIFKYLVKDLRLSVVNISVQGATAIDNQLGDSKLQEELPKFFTPPKGKLRSVGSGFIISEDGYIATNYHVIKDADKIVVSLFESKKDQDATLIGYDDKTDVALIKIETKTSLFPVYFGDSEKIDVGEWVLAIGNQFQLGQTVTAGIISAKSRRVPSNLSGPYDRYLQTDASINPGSSGGPLFNRQGQVIGINTAIFSPGRSKFGGSGFNIGIGFAIPINLAKSILVELSEKGEITRGVLGVIIQNIDDELSVALGLNSTEGAIVAEVRPGSPADKAGFKAKDVIINYEGSQVLEHSDLPLLVAETKIDTKVKVKIIRNKKELILEPVITKLTDDYFEKIKEKNTANYNKLGFRVSELTADIREELNINESNGLLIVDVAENSIVSSKGILEGDILLELNNVKISSKRDLKNALKSIKTNKPFLVVIKTKLGTRLLALTYAEK